MTSETPARAHPRAGVFLFLGLGFRELGNSGKLATVSGYISRLSAMGYRHSPAPGVLPFNGIAKALRISLRYGRLADAHEGPVTENRDAVAAMAPPVYDVLLIHCLTRLPL